jgi:hypothetical protein
MPDGSPCEKPVTHFWGTVEFCCEHFDAFVWGSIVPGKGEYKPSHLEMIEEYNRRTGRTSMIPGAACDAEKKK